MHSISSLRTKLENSIGALDFQSKPSELYEPIIYTMNFGGKRIRPLLVLLGCDLFNGDVDTGLRPALAIELFHNFTLLHDDIMDNAPLRRGKETVYKKWNTNVAILSGDTMFAIAYDFLTEVDPLLLPGMLKLFTKTAREVCEGQQYDMNFEKQPDVTIAEYIEMIRLKTAVLFGCSLKLGAILGHASVTDANNIYSFGENIGLGFQLQDDLLDVFGNVEKFGKEIGGDIVSNKKTFLYLKAMELAESKDLKELQRCYTDEDIPSIQKIEKVKEIYSNLNIREKTREQIDIYYNNALECLQKINVEESRKEELKKLAKQLLGRDY
jgi:geranylgeranyl diphosphate synthase, type II